MIGPRGRLVAVPANLRRLRCDHALNSTIRPFEWIPIIFGFSSGLTLLLAGAVALRRRRTATVMATLVFVASMLVGALGAYFHIQRGTLPSALSGQRVTVGLPIWAPP